jgi:hypothetical protein
MSFINRKKGSIPPWASFFSETEYAAFLSAIDSFFQNTLHLPYTIQDGAVIPAENEYNLNCLGLTNLARICKQNEPVDYPEIVASHFNGMIEAEKFQKEFDKTVTDYDRVKQYIAVRLYDEGYFSSIGKEAYMSREFAGELVAVLVFDLPHTVCNIKPEQAAPWGKTEDELFEAGLDNVRRNYEIKAEAAEFGADGDFIYACEAAHFFATNVLFDLDKHARLVGKGGALVAAPNRHITLVYPICDMKKVVGMINNLCVAVPGIYDNNPGALTKEIYWYKDGRFLPLPYKFDNKRISFYPPEEFVELLNGLASGQQHGQ